MLSVNRSAHTRINWAFVPFLAGAVLAVFAATSDASGHVREVAGVVGFLLLVVSLRLMRGGHTGGFWGGGGGHF
jgi:hypothetical protein